MIELVTSLLPALTPALADGVRGLFQKLTGGAGAAPANVEEAVKLMDADVRRLEALARLDAVGDVHKWVNDIRALQRPVAMVIVLGGYWAAVAMGSDAAPEWGGMARMALFYLFGDRTYFYLRRAMR